jgi:hypothetical protein
MPSMVVYWFFNWCRYVGHSDVGLYCMVLGGKVAIICICICDGEGVLFLIGHDGCGVVGFLGCHVGPMD